MILSEADISHSLGYGDLDVEYGGPFTPRAIEPASIDLHLGEELLIPDTAGKPVDVTDEDTYPEFYERTVEKGLSPQGFALATTEEEIDLPPGLVGTIHGRSSVGRLGLFVHNAGFIDPGFEGQVTLELFNAARYPIELETGMRICQLALHEVKTEPDVSYSEENGNKYDGQRGPTPSRLYEDF